MTTMTKVAHFTCDVCDVIRDGAVKFSKWFWKHPSWSFFL